MRIQYSNNRHCENFTYVMRTWGVKQVNQTRPYTSEHLTNGAYTMHVGKEFNDLVGIGRMSRSSDHG